MLTGDWLLFHCVIIGLTGMGPEFLRIYQRDGPYQWTGLLLGAPLLVIWFHCCDQEMVQRGLAAKNKMHARAGAITAGFLKVCVASHAIPPHQLRLAIVS